MFEDDADAHWTPVLNIGWSHVPTTREPVEWIRQHAIATALPDLEKCDDDAHCAERARIARHILGDHAVRAHLRAKACRTTALGHSSTQPLSACGVLIDAAVDDCRLRRACSELAELVETVREPGITPDRVARSCIALAASTWTPLPRRCTRRPGVKRP